MLNSKQLRSLQLPAIILTLVFLVLGGLSVRQSLANDLSSSSKTSGSFSLSTSFAQNNEPVNDTEMVQIHYPPAFEPMMDSSSRNSIIDPFNEVTGLKLDGSVASVANNVVGVQNLRIESASASYDDYVHGSFLLNSENLELVPTNFTIIM